LALPTRANHFVLIADGGLDEDGPARWLVLAKKSAFTPDEYAAVADHVAQ